MADSRLVFFFDIDNCLYPKSKKVYDHTVELIDKYFMEHISLNREDAHELHLTYSKTYGLAIEGLVRHHEISALEFNAKVDDALPLEDILKPDPELRKLIQDIDARKVKLWLFTNAYVTHGKRVVRILGIDDLFEGITFCDYAVSPLQCKPHRAIFDKAMSEAGVQDPKQCFFVDDSAPNCAAAEKMGWTATHLLEEGIPAPEGYVFKNQISHLQELRALFPQFFRPQTENVSLN